MTTPVNGPADVKPGDLVQVSIHYTRNGKSGVATVVKAMADKLTVEWPDGKRSTMAYAVEVRGTDFRRTRYQHGGGDRRRRLRQRRARSQKGKTPVSHFSVTVRLPGHVNLSDIIEQRDGVLGRALAPFQENNMGDCPREYLIFHDTEDEYRMEYETGSAEFTQTATGYVSKYDRRGEKLFKQGASFAETPFKTAYATFEDFVASWYGGERDPELKRFGYWENPDKKWDWWTIGGRWRGSLRVLPSAKNQAAVSELHRNPFLKEDADKPDELPTLHVDVCRICDLDRDALAGEHAEAVQKGWQDYLALGEYLRTGAVPLTPAGEPDPWFECTVRDRMMDIGVLICEEAAKWPDEALNGRTFKRWRRDHTAEMIDVLVDVKDSDAFASAYGVYYSPLTTYAFLDATSAAPVWSEPGRMGWFGCSSATPDSRQAYYESFHAWLRGGEPRDWLVVVDCHI